MEWIREIELRHDGESKTEIHKLQDCFGTVHIVQLGLLNDAAPDYSLASEMMEMELRAKAYADKLCSRGEDPQKHVQKGWGELDVTDCENCRKK